MTGWNEASPRPQHWAISVTAVIVAMMAIQMSSLGFSPLLPAIRKELAASYSQMGFFTGVYGLMAILISLPAGMLAARFGEKRMLLCGLAVLAAGLAGLGSAHSFALALAGRAVWLIGYRIAFVCVFTAMAVVTPEKYRSRTMGVFGAMAALASVIGAPFGTRLAESVGWRGGIFGFAIIALVGGILFASLYHPFRAHAAPAAGPHGHALTAKSLSALRNPIMWGLILLGLINLGGFSATFFVPYAVESVFGLNARASAALISGSYLTAILLNLAAGYLCDRFPRWNIMIVLALLLVPASFAALSHDLFTFRIAIALVVSLGHVATNQIYAITGAILTKAEAGAGMGLIGLGSGIFGYLGPQMLGYLRDATGGFTAGWFFVAFAAVVSLLDLLVLRAYSSRAQRGESVAARTQV
ncbi:MAG: MFS transporter [Acidobacteriia bacterium]|nr:MFS transporter [Terriglobia bacterium]